MKRANMLMFSTEWKACKMEQGENGCLYTRSVFIYTRSIFFSSSSQNRAKKGTLTHMISTQASQCGENRRQWGVLLHINWTTRFRGFNLLCAKGEKVENIEKRNHYYVRIPDSERQVR